MNERQPDLDLRAAVIVPSRPGPLVRLRDLEHRRAVVLLGSDGFLFTTTTSGGPLRRATLYTAW